MKPQARAQDALPIEEVAPHPMWKRPTPDQCVQLDEHIAALRKEIARMLTPFDGKPGRQTDEVTAFCKDVYFASGLFGTRDPIWMLGQIALAYNQRDGLSFPALPRFLDAFNKAVIKNSPLRNR